MVLRKRMLLLGVVAAGCLGRAMAGGPALDPAARELSQEAAPLDAVEVVSMPAQNNERLLEKALELGRSGPYRFAQSIDYPMTPADFGTWETLPNGDKLWRLRVYSEGARSINLGFTQYDLPKGASLYIYAADKSQVLGPFNSSNNADHGQLWTPIINAEEVVVELRIKPELVDKFRLVLGKVNHGFRSFGSEDKSGSCNVDVVCSQGDAWRDQIRSVGAYTVGGVDTCSGALINNTAQDDKGYFLTANHCGLTTGNAPSVVIYWNYQNSTCRTPGSTASGNPGNGSRTQFNSGTSLRATSSTSDFTLLELTQPLNPAHNLYFSGWDRRDAAPGSAVAIHHPSVEEKRISFENNATSITNYLSSTTTSSGTHIRIADWDLGTTEGGSSGSPLFDGTSKLIVGQLHGGFAACGNNDADWYGRLFRSWTGGGSNATRLSNWLDPSNSGAQTLAGKNPGSSGGGDQFEPNQPFSSAFWLGPGNYPGLSVTSGAAGDDYYRVSVAPGAGFSARIEFSNANGDIDLYLVLPDGSQLASSETTGDFEELSVKNAGSAPADLLVRVVMYTSATTSSYRLKLNSALPVPAVNVSNISTRARSQTGDSIIIAGFIIEGTQPKAVAIRGLGQGLGTFGVPGVLPNATLRLFSGSSMIQSNDNWGSDPWSGMFSSNALSPPSTSDAAIFTTLAPGAYTAHLLDTSGATGNALVEVYDKGGSSRLTNISTRGPVGTGDNIMIAGFIISGSQSRRILVTGWGAGLGNFGVPGVLPNAHLRLFGSGSPAPLLAENTDWTASPNASLIQASTHAPPASSDAAIIADLPPGLYTAHLLDLANRSGNGLIEVYDLGVSPTRATKAGAGVVDDGGIGLRSVRGASRQDGKSEWEILTPTK